MSGFLKLFLCGHLYVYVFVCLPSRLLITSGMMWYDIDPIWLDKQVLQLYVATVGIIVNRCSIGIGMHLGK